MFTFTKRWLRPGVTWALLAIPVAAQASSNPCDLNQDGTVNSADVVLAVNMTLGVIPCTAQIGGSGVCNVAVLQRVVNAAIGAPCVTGPGAVPHYVVLSWVPSVSDDIVGYNVYKSSAANGPYTKLNSSLIPNLTFTDNFVASGNTYYYTATAVDGSNNESAYSVSAVTTAPSP
jgi:hypothetical protein